MDSHGQALMLNEPSSEVYSLVKIQRLAERIAETHAMKEPTGDPEMDALTAEVNVQMYQNELQEWRNTTPDSIRNLRKCISMITFPNSLKFCDATLTDHMY